jgi:hypothetical protein
VFGNDAAERDGRGRPSYDGEKSHRAAARQQHIADSLATLREAIAAGWKDFDHIQKDPDLAPLRDLPEFKTLWPGKEKDQKDKSERRGRRVRGDFPSAFPSLSAFQILRPAIRLRRSTAVDAMRPARYLLGE